jgi:hypothetical protein
MTEQPEKEAKRREDKGETAKPRVAKERLKDLDVSKERTKDAKGGASYSSPGPPAATALTFPTGNMASR